MYSYLGVKRAVFEVLEVGDSRLSKVFDQLIVWLILVSVAGIVLESFSVVAARYGVVLYVFEVLCIGVFSVEYLLRLWTADLKVEGGGVWGRLRWVFSPMALIDLLAVLPFYAPFLIAVDLRVLRVLRLVRLLRVLKLSRYNAGLQLIGEVISEKREELSVTLFTTFLLLMLASTLMFFVENAAQPELFSNVFISFWWAIATLTTVGYGDIYPVTTLGRVLSGMIALIGVGLVALPTGILSSEFMEKMHRDETCPHCGEKL